MEQNQSLHIDGLKCPIYSENDKRLLAFFSFWIEGVLTSLVAVLGIFGNTIVSFIISNKEMRNSFNLLLVSLACFDSTYVSNLNYIILLNISTWRKRGVASNPLFIIPGFFLHFSLEPSYGYLRFEGNGKIPLGR